MKPHIKAIIQKASKKGLVVSPNLFRTGYSIKLPNGGCYNAVSDSDMICYVNGY